MLITLNIVKATHFCRFNIYQNAVLTFPGKPPFARG